MNDKQQHQAPRSGAKRLVFIGSGRFGLRCLAEALATPQLGIEGIVTNRETFSISYRPEGVRNVLYADVARFASENNIPIRIMDTAMNEPGLIRQISQWRADMILMVGWYHMLPPEIRRIAPSYALHASLLPDYSGGAPLVWAMINGETETGITLFKVADGVDNGPIIAQHRQEIRPDDTIATLYERIEDSGLKLLREHLPKIASGQAVCIPQDESLRRTMPQRSPEDGLIDWTRPASVVHDFVRAQTKPYPGAFTYCDDLKITIWTTRLVPRPATIASGRPGRVESLGQQDGFWVWCGQDTGLAVTLTGVDDEDLSGAECYRRRLGRPGSVLSGGAG
jgi:methionyl-tRNA formyltransferase